LLPVGIRFYNPVSIATPVAAQAVAGLNRFPTQIQY
jgi:hypothetical protein